MNSPRTQGHRGSYSALWEADEGNPLVAAAAFGAEGGEAVQRRLQQVRRSAATAQEHAVQVAGLVGGIRVSDELGEALHAAQAQHGDVVLAAECLDEREMDLQSQVCLVVLVRRQDAQQDAVRVPVKKRTSTCLVRG